MPTWKVVTVDGEQSVTAGHLVVDAGTLIFKHESGQVERVFAPGYWRTCEKVSQGSVGYGSSR